MYTNIVVPLDGSSFGELALPFAYAIARRNDASVRFLTVIPPLPPYHEGDDRASEEAGHYLMAREEAERYHADLRRRVESVGWNVPTLAHVEMGGVVEELDGYVRATDVDLLVMTTHGRGPLRRAWLGSVADGLLRRTPCPVLAVRPRPGQQLSLVEPGFRHILVTLDGSPEAREILPFAGALAKSFGSAVTLLRVIPPQFPVASSLASHLHYGFEGWEGQESAARELLSREAEDLEAQGLAVDVRVVKGIHPADGILKFSASEDVDLVAMTTHGRGGVARLVLGSVADKVLRGASVPLLLHRAR
jgi:nucleotide-binding universal stress UspA family protein